MTTKTDLISKFDGWIKELETVGGESLHRITRLRSNIDKFDEDEDTDILASIERLGNSIVTNSK